jgi:hypothetical protein
MVSKSLSFLIFSFLYVHFNSHRSFDIQEEQIKKIIYSNVK